MPVRARFAAGHVCMGGSCRGAGRLWWPAVHVRTPNRWRVGIFHIHAPRRPRKPSSMSARESRCEAVGCTGHGHGPYVRVRRGGRYSQLVRASRERDSWDICRDCKIGADAVDQVNGPRPPPLC